MTGSAAKVGLLMSVDGSMYEVFVAGSMVGVHATHEQAWSHARDLLGCEPVVESTSPTKYGFVLVPEVASR